MSKTRKMNKTTRRRKRPAKVTKKKPARKRKQGTKKRKGQKGGFFYPSRALNALLWHRRWKMQQKQKQK